MPISGHPDSLSLFLRNRESKQRIPQLAKHFSPVSKKFFPN